MMTIREMIERMDATTVDFERVKVEGKNAEAIRIVPTTFPMGTVVQPIDGHDGTVAIRATVAIDGKLQMLPGVFGVLFDGAPVLWSVAEERLK